MQISETASSEGGRQFIKFLATGQEFATDIMSVREIRGWTETTKVPHAPHYVLGVINLRGVVLPVIDLKARLGMGLTEPCSSHVIIVLESGARTTGVLVDAVLDIMSVSADQIQPVPALVCESQNDYMGGIAVIDEKMVTLLEIDKLMADVDSFG